MKSAVVHLCEQTLPLAWEASILKLYAEGFRIPTQYDGPEDPPSIDATAIIEVIEPFTEPRIHRCFPDSIAGLESYRQEMVDGIHDHWIDPKAGKWEYTYHERFAAYNVPGIDKPINQIDYIVDALRTCSYTRRAQAITWKPWEDAGISDPACLQRIHCRIVEGRLCMNVHMRSNDAFKAAFMNAYAFTDLQRVIAERVGVPVGRYIHIADSYHIYGAYMKDVEAFIDTVKRRPVEKRTFRTEDVAELIEEARDQIRRSLEEEQRTGRKGL
jgi:thymidylate synthase